MANEISSAFDSAFADGPGTNPTQPDKFAVRAVGRVIQAAVDGLSNISTGKWVPFISQAVMNSSLNYADGVEGRVYVPTGKGVYRKTGATGTGSWTYVGPIPEGDTTALAARANPQLTVSGDIIDDRYNMLGGGAAVYIPQGVYMAGLFTATLTPQDARIPGYFKVSVELSSAVTSIYYDLADQAIKTSVFPTVMPSDPARYFHIVSFYGVSGGVTGDNRIKTTKSLQARTVASDRPFIFDLDQGVLSIPQLRGYIGATGTWILAPLDNVRPYRTVSIPKAPANTAVTFIWVDVRDILRNGSSSASALKVVQGFDPVANQLPSDGGDLVLIGTIYGETFHVAPSVHAPVARMLPNQCGVGKTDNDLARYRFFTSRPVALKRSESTGLGFARGYAAEGASDTGYRTFYGDTFAEKLLGGVVFARWYIETDVAGDFGGNFAGFAINENGQAVSMQTVNVAVALRISDNLRVYEGWFRMPRAYDVAYAGCWIGFDHSVKDVARMFGLQYAASADILPCVAFLDYPRANHTLGNRLALLEATASDGLGLFEPAIPPMVPVMEGRPTSVYLSQMFDQSRIGTRALATFTKVDQGGFNVPAAIVTTAQDPVTIPAEILPTGETIMQVDFVDNAGLSARRIGRQVKVRKVTAAQVDAFNFNMLTIGDSISDWNGTVVNSVRRLMSMGATVNMIGTLQMDGYIPGIGALAGEARGGKRAADHTFIETTGSRAMIPIAAGGEAAYLALDSSDTGKRYRNPFLKVPSSDDTTNRSDMVKNGYIFDPQFYFTRFGFSPADLVWINLGTNDISLYPTLSAAIAAIVESFRIMRSQFRRQYPNVKVIFAWNSFGRGSDGDTRWNSSHLVALRAVMKYLNATGDDKTFLFPGYCMVNRESAFPLSAGTVDDNGLLVRNVSDPIHYGYNGVAQFGEAGAQFIAAVMA